MLRDKDISEVLMHLKELVEFGYSKEDALKILEVASRNKLADAIVFDL